MRMRWTKRSIFWIMAFSASFMVSSDVVLIGLSPSPSPSSGFASSPSSNYLESAAFALWYKDGQIAASLFFKKLKSFFPSDVRGRP